MSSTTAAIAPKDTSTLCSDRYHPLAPLISLNMTRSRNQRATRHESGFRRQTCPWSENSSHNGPCVVIESLCNGEQSCTCSNLVFILNGACDYCDGDDSALSWEHYSQSSNCTSPSPVPKNLPDPTASNAVPAWALALAAATPTPSVFRIQDALSLANNDDTASFTRSAAASSSSSSITSSSSSVPTQSDSSTSAATSTMPAPSSSSSPTPTPASGSSTLKTKAGLIVGGIIGGALLVALVCIAYIMRRRRQTRNHVAPSAAYKAAIHNGSAFPISYQPVRQNVSHSTEDPKHASESWPSRPTSMQSQSRFIEHTS
ncbi:hypothetical protein GGX14DRAFT_436277 [Mycena pura]|uniref:Extracellular membrane protein CFEM domain-containing protein n=1 Tax=Mycena pura TaxID=153505 RepID=A0AAD6VQZ9_9AGAR|nr:hypothetical protein GGX14DRAFT_436277 [Mycena pura]